METTIQTVGLTSDDVKALRQADQVSFHFHQDQGSIVATKRVKNPGPFGERERRHEFNVSSSFSGNKGSKPRQCFAMEHGASYSETWQTIAQSLKAGDEVTLHWSADGERTGYLEGAKVSQDNTCAAGMELHADALYLQVRRGDKRLSFFLSVSICPDNTARMIRF